MGDFNRPMNVFQRDPHEVEALLPCPFCGSTMQVAMRDAMLCLECYATGPQDEDRKTAWNRRAAIPARGLHSADAVLDAAHDYLMQQYGHSPLKHPVDRARILANLTTEYTLAPHLQKIVDGAKTTPQWDMQADRLAPTGAAQAREAALRDALSAIDALPEYGSPDVNIGVGNAYSAVYALLSEART